MGGNENYQRIYMLKNRILPEIIYFKEMHCRPHKKNSDFGAPSAGRSDFHFAFPLRIHHRNLKKPTTFLAINCTFHTNMWYQGRRGFFFLYIRRTNACKAVLLALQLEENHKWGLKIDCTTSGISFAVFEDGNSHLQSFPPLPPPFSFFSLPNQRGIN